MSPAMYRLRLVLLPLAMVGSLIVLSRVSAAEPQDPNCVGTVRDRLVAIEQYVMLIDSLMAAERIDARHVQEQLWKNIPPCRFDNDNEILEFAKRSRFFINAGEAQGVVTFLFVTRERGQNFEIGLSYPRSAKTIFPSAINRKYF